MARTRIVLCALFLLGLALMLTSGCFKVEGNVKVGVNGTSDVELTVAMSEALAQMAQDDEGTEEGAEEGTDEGTEEDAGPADPLAELKENVPEGWQATDVTEEGWVGVTLTGRVEPGQPLFPEGEGDEPGSGSDVHVRVVQRQFSTDYYVEGTLAPPGGDETLTTRREPQGGVVFTQFEEEGSEEEGDDEAGVEAFGNLLGALGDEPTITFTISAPGTIVETSGVEVDDGTALWAMGMDDFGEQEAEEAFDISLHTRLLNYQSIGRLVDKLAAERDLPDVAVLVADYVSRDLLPNPPKDDPLRAGIDAEAYEAAIGTIIALEDALGETTAARVINGLKLNADGVSARELNETWALIGEMEAEELTEVAAEAIVKHVRMRRK